LSGFQRIDEFCPIVNDAHASPATACDGFDNDGIANAFRRRDRFLFGVY
jgi:hypothetical protein